MAANKLGIPAVKEHWQDTWKRIHVTGVARTSGRREGVTSGAETLKEAFSSFSAENAKNRDSVLHSSCCI